MEKVRTGTFRAGFAKGRITPPKAVQMSGFAARTGLSEGVHDHLWARAAAFSDGGATALLIVLDVIGTDAALTDLIRQTVASNCGVPPPSVAVVATHTHGGPAVLRDSQLGEVDPGLHSFIADKAAAAARQAVVSMTPCEVRSSRGYERTVASNRRDPAGPVDHSLNVLRFDAPDRCLGLIVSYACHPVVLGPDNLLLTRDYPGFLVDALEADFPGASALFMPGASGQLNTGHSAHDSWSTKRSDRRSFAEARRIGQLLASVAGREAAAAMDRPPLESGTVNLVAAHVTLNVSNDPELPAITNKWRDELARLPAGSDRRPLLEASLRWADGVQLLPEEVSVEVQVLGICGHALALFPGEVFTEYGLALKERFGEKVTTVGYANCAPGYLPADDALTEGGYEVAEAHRFYGQRGPFAAGSQGALVYAMTQLVGDVHALRS